MSPEEKLSSVVAVARRGICVQLKAQYDAARTQMETCMATKDECGRINYLRESEAYRMIFDDLRAEIHKITNLELMREWSTMLAADNAFDRDAAEKFARADEFLGRHPDMFLSHERMEARLLLVRLCRLPFPCGPKTDSEPAITSRVRNMCQELLNITGSMNGDPHILNFIHLATYYMTWPSIALVILPFLQRAHARFVPYCDEAP